MTSLERSIGRNLRITGIAILLAFIVAPAANAGYIRDISSQRIEHNWGDIDWGSERHLWMRADTSCLQRFAEIFVRFGGVEFLEHQVTDTDRPRLREVIHGRYDGGTDEKPVSGIPEAGAAVLFTLGLLAVLAVARRRPALAPLSRPHGSRTARR